MAVDQFELLQWLAHREEANPGALPTGSDVRWQARHLDRERLDPTAVSQALGRLRARDWISWVLNPWPNRQTEPAAHMIDDTTIQQVRDIAVTGPGFAALAGRQPPAPKQEINIVGSTVHQVAMSDLHNLTLAMILDGAERELNTIDAPAQQKAEVRTVLQRMRAAGSALTTAAGAELLAAVVTRALGLPWPTLPRSPDCFDNRRALSRSAANVMCVGKPFERLRVKQLLRDGYPSSRSPGSSAPPPPQ